MPLVLQASRWEGGAEAMTAKPAHGQLRQERKRHRRIDFTPDALALVAINAKYGRHYPLNTRSGVLNAILAEWLVLARIELPAGFQPKTSATDAAIVAQYARASDFGVRLDRVLAGVQARSKVTKRVICGARTQSDRPCRGKSLPGKQRCKWHGGKSTGPKSAEGRAKALRNLRQFRQKPP